MTPQSPHASRAASRPGPRHIVRWRYRLRWSIVALLASMVGFASLFGAGIAARAQERAPLITLAEFRVSEFGTAITSADRGESGGLYIEYDLDASGYASGDTFTYVLPSNFDVTAPTNTSFVFVATYNGADYAVGTVTYRYGTLRVVLDDGVELLDGIRGHFWIGGRYLGAPDTPDLTFNPGTDHEYTIPMTFTGGAGSPGVGGKQEHGKYATFKEGSNNSIVEYSVGVNMDTARHYLAGSTVTDRANGLVVNPATLKVERIDPTAVLVNDVDYTVEFFDDGSGFTITLLRDLDQEFWFSYESSVTQVAEVYRNDVVAAIPGNPNGGDAFAHEITWADLSGSSQGYLRDLTLVKRDKDTDRPLQGAVFDLYRIIDGNDRLIRQGLTTGADGMLLADGLLAGEYRLVEVTRPAGYAYVDGQDSVSVTLQPGQSASIELDFYNEREPAAGGLAAVELSKADDSGAPLEGAEFTLYDADGAIRGIHVTDATGYARFADLDPGEYTVRETRAPFGFLASREALAGYPVTAIGGETTAVRGSAADGAIVNLATPVVVEPAAELTTTTAEAGLAVTGATSVLVPGLASALLIAFGRVFVVVGTRVRRATRVDGVV